MCRIIKAQGKRMKGYLRKLYVMGLKVIYFLSNFSGMWLYYRNKWLKIFLCKIWLSRNTGKHQIISTQNYTLGMCHVYNKNGTNWAFCGRVQPGDSGSVPLMHTRIREESLPKEWVFTGSWRKSWAFHRYRYKEIPQVSCTGSNSKVSIFHEWSADQLSWGSWHV